MADVRLAGIHKTYHEAEVIHGVDCHIADGEFLVIVGPSGCGKSTLLRMVAGLETITDGDIHIGERVVNDLEPAERDIAMVFQNYALYPHMSVFNNMAYGLKIRGLAKSEIEERRGLDELDAAGEQEIDDLLLEPRSIFDGAQASPDFPAAIEELFAAKASG